MRTVVCVGNEHVAVQEIDVPEPEADEALIEVKATGICGSELYGYQAKAPEGETVISRTAHEFAGVVRRPGNTGLLQEGDRIVVCDVGGCGACAYCRDGHENYCSVIPKGRRHVKPGGHAEFITFVERCCLKIPDAMSFETAIAVGGCGIGVAWHGIKRLGIRKDERVLILGTGPIGLAATMLVRHLGAVPVVSDISEYRLKLAEACGAQERIDGRAKEEEVLPGLKSMGIGNAVLCTGNHDAARLGLAALQPLGRMLVLGGLGKFPLNSYFMLGIGDKSLVGSWHYHRCEWDEIMAMVEAGLPAHKLVTHTFPFAQAEEAYRIFVSGQTGKVVLRP